MEFLNFYSDEQIFSASKSFFGELCPNFFDSFKTNITCDFEKYISLRANLFLNKKCIERLKTAFSIVILFIIHYSCSSGTKPSLLTVHSFGHGLTQEVTRDVVYCILASWPIAPSYMSPNAGGGRSWGLSQWDEYSCAHGAQINFGDLTPHLTYGLTENHVFFRNSASYSILWL